MERSDHIKKENDITTQEAGPISNDASERNNEIATNDGSIIETLDTALHGKPGWVEGENLSGSSRADYYEAQSYGKSDSEEEVDELRKQRKVDKLEG